MQQQIDADLKQAMLSGDKPTAEALRVIKGVLQNEAIAAGAQTDGLNDEKVTQILQREAKKRKEAAELYKTAGESGRAAQEETEAKLIEKYLPAAASEEEITAAVETEIASLESPSPADMGKIIGAVRAKLGTGADGALIARIVKEKL